MKVGIVGAGSIAFGMAAFLERAGHKATLWSPSGERTQSLGRGRAARRRRCDRGDVQAGDCRERRRACSQRRRDSGRPAGLRSQARVRQDRAAHHADADGDRQLARLVRRALSLAPPCRPRHRRADHCLEHHPGERPSGWSGQGPGEHGAQVRRSRHLARIAQRGGSRPLPVAVRRPLRRSAEPVWRSRSAISIRRSTWASRSAT